MTNKELEHRLNKIESELAACKKFLQALVRGMREQHEHQRTTNKIKRSPTSSRPQESAGSGSSILMDNNECKVSPLSSEVE